MLLPDAPVSIDIGSFSVKVAQVRGGRAGVRSVRFAEQRLPEGYHWEAGASPSPLVEAIRQAMRMAGIRARRAVFAIPRRHVIARISAFPHADRAQLQRVVEVDLADHIPFPVDQVVVDFQSLGPSLEQPGMLDVLVVAAQRDLVRQYLDLARALGMGVAGISVDAFALHDLTAQRQENAPGMQLALELGRRATTITVAEGKRLRLSRSIPVGTLQLAAALRDDLGVSVEEAEVRRLTDGLRVLSEQPRSPRVRAWLENLCGEMRRSALSFGQAALSRIYLAGAGAQTPGLADALGTEFGSAPVLLTPVSLFPTAMLQGPDSGAAERCLLAIGLGLRSVGRSVFSISLLPREVTSARRQTRLQQAGVVAALALVGLTAASYTTTKHKVELLRREDQKLVKIVEEAEAKTGKVSTLQEQAKQLTDDLRELEPASAHRYAALELLKTISEGADPEIIVGYFALRPDQPLLLRGSAPNMGAAADLVAALQRSPLVSVANLDRVDRVPTSTGLGGSRRTPRSAPGVGGPPAGRGPRRGPPPGRGPRGLVQGPGVASVVDVTAAPVDDARVNFIMTVHLRTEKTLKSRRALAGALESGR